jgi:signal transduction histidine kinase/HD-like signal output (HDOD) protein
MERDPRQPAPQRAERVDLILHQLDSLPTLSSVAVRLLQLTADDEADAQEIIALVASDPSLTSKVLALCRRHSRGRGSEVSSIERAVLLLGFEALRYIVLSVQVFEVIDSMAGVGGETGSQKPIFDREAFWLHSLSTAIAAERLAEHGTLARSVSPSEAFTAGLLHDLGQLALHVVLPESFDRVCRITEMHSASLDHACRQIIGLDTHTVGKRLAEHWRLPQALVDAIWLNGQAPQSLPATDHHALVAVVSLADALVRSRYIAAGAHGSRFESISALCIPVGIDPSAVEAITADLHEETAERAEALGLSVDHDHGSLLRAILRANESLARANLGMRMREQIAQRQSKVLAAISEFHQALSADAGYVDVLTEIAQSASRTLQAAVTAAVYESTDGHGWRLIRIGANGRAFGSRIVNPPVDAVPLDAFMRDVRSGASAAMLLPWLGEYLPETPPLRNVRLLPLRAGRALLLMDGETPSENELSELMQCWQASLSSGAQRDAAAHLTERLAESNRTLLDTRQALSRSQTMATLGEVASGAAHEMNNPLTIMSGRSQLLASRLTDPDLHAAAMEIVNQSHRLSDMITALRSFAEPIDPSIRTVDLGDLVLRAVQQSGAQERSRPQVNTVFAEGAPQVHVDPDLIGAALTELVRNALEAKGCTHIELRVQTDPLDGRLKIEVRDNGSGLSEHALTHAFDPFFSAKPAGRQPGLGLARASRFVEAHGGRITLVNAPSGGAIATIWLEDWRAPGAQHAA